MSRERLVTSLALIPWSLLVRVLWLEVAILHVPVFRWIGMVYTQLRRQRLAVAHIKTEMQCEKELETRLSAGEDVGKWLYSQQAMEWIHLQLFDSLTEQDLTLSDGSIMVPGQIRTREVSVGNHLAPTASSLPLFLNRWSQVYGNSRRGEASIVSLSAAHQRLAWVHPFLDGNGRVTRLHTHLALHAQGLTQGLWSPLRGYARSESRYKALIMAADEGRRGALDGRGNLTESGLIAWMNYTLDICIDQVKFMSSQLNVSTMQDRIAAALMFEESIGSGVRKEALRPLHYLFITQLELGRADFKTMTGLGDRVSTQALSSLLKNGYLSSDSPYGKVRLGIPRHALRFYFPALWPEAEQDELTSSPP